MRVVGCPRNAPTGARTLAGSLAIRGEASIVGVSEPSRTARLGLTSHNSYSALKRFDVIARRSADQALGVDDSTRAPHAVNDIDTTPPQRTDEPTTRVRSQARTRDKPVDMLSQGNRSWLRHYAWLCELDFEGPKDQIGPLGAISARPPRGRRDRVHHFRCSRPRRRPIYCDWGTALRMLASAGVEWSEV